MLLLEGSVELDVRALTLTSSSPPPDVTRGFSTTVLRPQIDHLPLPGSSASNGVSKGGASGSPSLDRLIQGANAISPRASARRDRWAVDTFSKEVEGAGFGFERAYRCRSWVTKEERIGG